jgi:hypothetical protein
VIALLIFKYVINFEINGTAYIGRLPCLLKQQVKRIAYRKGRNAAITATARKLAIIVWNMITKTQSYQQANLQLLFEKRKYAQVGISKRDFLGTYFPIFPRIAE